MALIGFVPASLVVLHAATAQEIPADSAHERRLGETVDYLADVKPILVRRCYACHGPDGESRESDLRFDRRDDATRDRDGYAVIVPGRSDESELLYRIASDDPGDLMPPSGEPLSAEEIDIVRRWIDQGAEYARHWSFEPVRDPVTPDPGSAGDGLVRDPIDAFILDRLESSGLHAAGDAEPAEQIRRLAFDVTGLPPKPDRVRMFEDDPSDEQWAGIVDDYLDSPAFGERWGRHWLDLVRYAETYGHEFDYPIHEAWKYRDYVIQALNEDLPYDRFLTEHVAGDIIEPRIDDRTGTNQSELATGFWHLHQGVHAPTDVRLDEIDRVDNQIDVLTKTFMGLTVSCARCHDHKFDPISQADYYGLAGYLRSSRRDLGYQDPYGRLALIHDDLQRIENAFRREIVTASDESSRSVLMRTLDTVHDALVEPGSPGSVPNRHRFEDFEDIDFSGWTAEGTAFGRGTQDKDSVREPFKSSHTDERTRMVNTCDDRNGALGDGETGTLTSREFVIRHPGIEFVMSGGRYPGETCVDLIIDGVTVRTETGRSDAVLRTVVWDVEELIGRTARIRIVDTKTGGWGHVVVDDFDFVTVPGCRSDLDRTLDELADATGMNESDVRRWITALHDPDLAHTDHPLHPWSMNDPVVHGSGPSPAVVFDDGTGVAGWYRSGLAWPVGDEPVLHSGHVDDRFQGTIRSRTFTLEHDHIMIRVRGRGTVRLIVNGFMMDQFNPLLFDGFKQNVSGGWRVLTMRTNVYKGQRAWIELIDDTDGFLEVDWIGFDDDAGHGVASTAPSDPSWSDPDVLNWLFANGIQADLPADASGIEDLLVRHQDRTRDVAPDIPAPPRVLTMQDGPADEEWILLRGNHLTPGSKAPRGLISEVSPGFRVDKEGSGRLELARAMLDPSNPFTSRVAVNRIWHHLTGRGIVPTTDDFGALGAMPSHPELLDHLASDFATDWSIKRVIRRILLSSTYRRSSIAPSRNDPAIDPVNDLMAHARVRRLQGEAIRDAALAVSGRLNETSYGPPVPIHLTSFMSGRGRPGRSGPVDGDGRRSIYLEVRRNFPLPFLTVFDLPVPTSTIGRRNVSNVPAQSLTMMNDPFIHQMARSWSERALEQGSLDELWWEAFSRRPLDEELAVARQYLSGRENDADAWYELCHALMNTKEFTHLN